jgi:hypothetical protein
MMASQDRVAKNCLNCGLLAFVSIHGGNSRAIVAGWSSTS